MALTREHLMLAFYEHHYKEKVEDDQHLGNQWGHRPPLPKNDPTQS